jgi:hypothetical protein
MNSTAVNVLACAVLAISGPVEAKGQVSPCHWVHGRLTVGNGTPSTRIWPSGTHRMLGLVSLKHPDPEDGDQPAIPDNVENLITSENHTVWGDFYVCPVAPDRPGWMRFVVLKQARKLFVTDR